jgi:hypothetical protein
MRSLRRAGPSYRGVLPSVVCLNLCSRNLEKWGGLGPQGAVEPLEKKNSIWWRKQTIYASSFHLLILIQNQVAASLLFANIVLIFQVPECMKTAGFWDAVWYYIRVSTKVLEGPSASIFKQRSGKPFCIPENGSSNLFRLLASTYQNSRHYILKHCISNILLSSHWEPETKLYFYVKT